MRAAARRGVRRPGHVTRSQRQHDLETFGRSTPAAIADQAGENALATATATALIAGLILLGAGLLRLGFLADFVSVPVLTGFKAGMGLLIIVGQLGKVLGVEVSGDAFFSQLGSAIGRS